MKAEYLGARASNTGDDFHEWWALRLALQLLEPDTSLAAVTVCSGQVKLATVLESFQYKRSDSFGVNPPLY